jgi:hypothetical protein
MEDEPMTRQEFIEKMRALFPHADSVVAAQWAEWLKRQAVPYESMHNAFFGVHQQYGGELAGLLFIVGPRHYCLYPNEFMLAAEYLYQGGAIEQIDERPSHTEKECHAHVMEMSQGGYR